MFFLQNPDTLPLQIIFLEKLVGDDDFLSGEIQGQTVGEQILVSYTYEVSYFLIEYSNNVWGFATNRPTSRENPNVVVHALKQRGQHNMPIKGIKSTNSTNDANSTNGINGTNNCVPFGGRYSANIILFNQNHKITRFTRNQEIIKYEYKLGRP